MIEFVTKRIMMVYYGLYTGTVLATISGMLLTQDKEVIISAKSSLGIGLTSLVVIYVMASIPLSLGIFFRSLKKWRAIEDEKTKFKKYESAAKLRLLFIGIGLLSSIIVFFLQRTDMSLIYCAGISGIALIFCRPTVAKTVSDLQVDE